MPFRRTSIDSDQRTGFYSPKLSRVVGSRDPDGFDADALIYINAVEAADGEALEFNIKTAYNAFVVGCKSDGIWSAIKASCIMAGARTLSGALVPLVGIAPSGFNLASGEYSRASGLRGDGVSMYLNSNRNNNDDPQDNAHISAFGTQWGATTASPKAIIGRQVAGYNERALLVVSTLDFGNLNARVQSRDAWASHGLPRTVGFVGASRSTSSGIVIRNNQTTVSRNQTSAAPSSFSLFIFATSDGVTAGNAGNTTGYDDSRLAFYSIGESLNLDLLDNRVTVLMSGIQNAIP